MRKLGWRSPAECLTRNTPDMSSFRFHMWEEAWCLDTNMKELKSKHELARFLDISWDYGDNLCYCIRTIPTRKKEWLAILIRSAVRSQGEKGKLEGTVGLTSFRVDKEKAVGRNPASGELNVSPPWTISTNDSSTLPSGENLNSAEPEEVVPGA